MKKLTTLLMVSTFVVFLASCGGGAKTEEESTTEETAAPKEEVVMYSQQTAVGVTHEVADVAAWKTAYRALSDSAAWISVMADNENPNIVTVFEWTKSHDTMKEFLNSDGFKTTLDSIGVISDLQIQYYDVKENSGEPALAYAIGISHEVSDYDMWKAKFDEDAEARTEAGMKFHAISTDADNPKLVYIMLSTDDLDSAMKMMDSDELKQKMTDAGVMGEPVVKVWVTPTAE